MTVLLIDTEVSITEEKPHSLHWVSKGSERKIPASTGSNL